MSKIALWFQNIKSGTGDCLQYMMCFPDDEEVFRSIACDRRVQDMYKHHFELHNVLTSSVSLIKLHAVVRVEVWDHTGIKE